MKTLCLLIITAIAVYAEENNTLPLPYETAVEGKSAYTVPASKVDLEAERLIQTSSALNGATGKPMHNFDTHQEASSKHKGH